MSSGPIIAMTLGCYNAVAHWKSLMGPVSITKAREIYPEWLVFLFITIYYYRVIVIICFIDFALIIFYTKSILLKLYYNRNGLVFFFLQPQSQVRNV